MKNQFIKKLLKQLFVLSLIFLCFNSVNAQNVSVVNGKISPLNANVYYGDSLRYSYLPNTGCVLDSIYVNGVYIGKDSPSAYTLKNITQNSSLRVVFKRQTFGIYQKNVLRRPGKPDSVSVKTIGNMGVDSNIVVKKQIDLPVNFESADVDYTLTNFEGAVSVLYTENGNKVVKTTKPTGAQPWAGTTIGSDKNGTNGAIKTPLPNSVAPVIKVLVKAPTAGIKVRLKIENSTDGTKSVETDATTRTANGWDTLEFNFANHASGTAAWSSSNTYNKISIFFDFLVNANDKVFYWDNVYLAPAVITPPVTFTPDSNIIKLLTNNSSRTWKIDTTSANWFGVGPTTSFFPDWYQAQPRDAKAVAFPCIINGRTTFNYNAATKAVTLNFVPNGGVFVLDVANTFYSSGSTADNCATLTVPSNNTVAFSAANSGSTAANSTLTQFTVGAKGLVNLGIGSNVYEIISISNQKLVLRSIVPDGKAWYQTLTPTDSLTIINPPIASKSKMDFPITFEDTANVNYAVTDFGSVTTIDSVISNNRLKVTVKGAGAQTWGGTTLGSGTTPSLKTAFSNSGAPKISVLVKSPAAGLVVKLKIETENNTGGTSTGEFVEKDVNTLTANGWDSLVFDFSSGTVGTWSASKTYTRLSIFFDFNVAGSAPGKTFLWDNIRFLGTTIVTPPVSTKSQINLPITFDSSSVDYTVTDFGGAVTSDTSIVGNKAKKTIKPIGAQTWAGTTMGTDANSPTKGALKTAFSNAAAPRVSVRVYTPAVGIKVRLKIEDANDHTKTVEAEETSTTAGWQTLTFNFANQAIGSTGATAAWNATSTYNKISIFFSFDSVGDGKVYLWDDVMLVP